MNCGLKTKTYLAGSGQTINSLFNILGPTARLLGITCSNIGVVTLDNASWVLYKQISGTDIPIANGKINAVGTLEWWAGINGRWKEGIVAPAPANDIAQGFLPIGQPTVWTDVNGLGIVLRIVVTLATTLSTCTLWYTDDEGTAAGEQL